MGEFAPRYAREVAQLQAAKNSDLPRLIDELKKGSADIDVIEVATKAGHLSVLLGGYNERKSRYQRVHFHFGSQIWTNSYL